MKKVDDDVNNSFKKFIDEIFKKKSKGESTKEVEDDIDKEIFKLYGLTKSDISLIEGSERMDQSILYADTN